MPRFLAAAAALLGLVGGCASLHGDGYYACARSGQCPPSAPVCGSDGFCHAAGTDAATSDAGTLDAALADTNVAPLTYPPCNGGTPGTCDPDSCYFDAFLAATLDGYCTRACVSDADCPAYGGATSMCLDGRCARGCRSETDCGDVLACSGGRWVDGAAVRLCVSFGDAEVSWYERCSATAPARSRA